MIPDGNAAKPGPNTTGRLADLDILDTAPEQGYDDIATLAAYICGTPIAYVSFIDGNRQWFKAKVGFDMAENTLELSFCQHTLRQASLLVIPDLTQDPRTAGSSLVTDAPNLRFYAGALLKSPSDETIGTICVMDVNPHATGLSFAQEHALQALARQVMELLQLRLLLRERALIARELNHRIKNTFTVVRSIARQSLNSLADAASLNTFDQRLEALSSAHKILIERDWVSGSFESVATTTLAPHAADGQASFDGPQIDINPSAAVSLSLLLHELATNAIKYGALSTPSGRVAIAWRVHGRDAEAELVLSWRESGGPPTLLPSQTGFGTRLIRSGLHGARKAELSFKPLGFEAEFKAPLRTLAVK